MAVGVANARDLAECALLNLLTDEQVNRITAPEVTGVEFHACRVDGVGHFVSVSSSNTEWLFRENMFFRGGGRQDEFFVAVSLGTDHNILDGVVVPDRREIGDDLRIEFTCAALGTLGVVIPDVLDLNVRAILDALDEARCVDVRAADQRDLFSSHQHYPVRSHDTQLSS